ncbi:MAG TPA: tripartite tricarboxylate transporter permease [Thermodesulfobacteriota bacterium]|nr:tripartite tricarboxylate transporter permease [Thermodesulfobacteriota bacterium]
MDSFTGLLNGFVVLATPGNLLALAAGVFLGTVVGVLPGLGPIGAMAILLPVSFQMEVTAALILMAGVFYGAQYGGSTTSILMNIPGESTSVVTTIDGYQMTRRGRAGAALTISAVGSFIAGTIAVALLMVFAPILGQFALRFGAPEYFALTVFGLMVLSRLTGGGLAMAFMLVGIGLALRTVGQEMMHSVSRYTFGNIDLWHGLELTPVVVGLFGIAEVLIAAEEKESAPQVCSVRLRELFPTPREWSRSIGAILRGTAIGFPFGLIPGPAAILSTFASYALERRVSKHPEEFGKGAIEGVAGPESANNAAAGGTLVPLLALGVPFAPPTALLLGAFVIHGVQPGPLLLREHPQVFWGLVASMYAGNVMLLILNLPMVGLFVSILRIPRDLLLAFIVLVSVVGVYSVNNSVFDLVVMLVMSVAGYGMRKFRLSPATLVLPLVIGSLMEESLVRTLMLARGDISYLLTRPIALGLLGAGAASLIASPAWRWAQRIWKKEKSSRKWKPAKSDPGER